MRILHVIRDLSVETGGPVRAVHGLAEAQARLGHDVSLLTTDIGAIRLMPPGVHLHIVHAQAARWAWSRTLKRQAKTLVPEADVVHLHMVWDHPVLVAAREARRLGVPYVLRPCGMFSDWSMSRSSIRKQVYLRLLGGPLRDANAYHFATAGEQANARSTVGDHRSFVIPIGVHVPADDALPAVDAFALRFPELRGRRIVLFLSRLHPKKHPDLLIDAFARAGAGHDDVALVLAGPVDDDYRSELHARARDRKIESRVVFTGLLSGDAVAEAYRAAEVFVLPSAHENFGVAAVEAMAMGCATIVSRRLDLAPDIEREGAALCVDLEVARLAEAIASLLADAKRRAELGAKARDFVQRRFAWEPIARATVDAYRALGAPRTTS